MTDRPVPASHQSGISRRSLMAGAGAAGLMLMAGGPSAFAKDADLPVAATAYGKVRGKTNTAGIHVFKGVRYGADTRQTRFQAPLPPTPWPDVQDAFDYGTGCPQTGNESPTSEDCLFLNVWTPALKDGKKRPVMVYFHGGAYAHGSGSDALYDGTYLCTRGDVVVVTVNHRLNIFGYLYLARFDDRFADSGNAGMLDLILALEWVRDNIAEFGGDADNVMLFGQSGGGAKIATLMAMPAARGLFHKGATMSGQQVTASGPMNATARAEAYLGELGLDRTRLDDLMAMDTAALIPGMKVRDPILPYGGAYFGPVFDESNLPRHPFFPDAPAQSIDIPMIIGNTHDETRLLIGRSEPDSFDLTWEQLPERIARHVRCDILPEKVVAEYRRIYPDYSPSDVFFAATTAGRSWRGAVIEAEERAKQGAPTWAYQLDWGSPRDGGKWGASHTFDIPLVFGTLDAEHSWSGTGPEAHALVDQMAGAFLAFAHTGKPDHAGIPAWNQYRLPDRATMVFDVTPHLENDPRGQERELFARVPFIQSGT
ncbi:MAG: carboxylesterase/lipase family protein [Alphaproteobacteria bacterium]|nr:MAG: carboxylesterase/lipase family protein [Alphaproteobacteria bacterium]